jgi:hypothetical protein
MNFSWTCINERPAYTDTCKFKEDRSTLCKFRISAHSLEIEKGRYYNIPREHPVCLSCKAGKVEDFFEKIYLNETTKICMD